MVSRSQLAVGEGDEGDLEKSQAALYREDIF